jgi:hypothetical protein
LDKLRESSPSPECEPKFSFDIVFFNSQILYFKISLKPLKQKSFFNLLFYFFDK